MTVAPGGITYGRKPLLRWDELAGWKLGDGLLTLERAAERGLTVPMTEVERGWVLVTLLADRARR